MRGVIQRLALLTLLSVPLAAADFSHGGLRVSDNHRYLVHRDGTPFFYLGDTAWELFHRLNREDTERYLENRRQKGFTVIQAVVLAEFDGLHTPNAYGETPLRNDDPTQPNEAYFRHVDAVVKMAEAKGLYIGMLPTWGNKVVKGSWEKTAPVIFNPENALVYGRFIGSRYKNAPNIIWILGGDRDPTNVVPVWRAMAQGVREGDAGRHLITFHPNGRHSSSEVLHNEPWLDFNMAQSGHNRRDNNNDEIIDRDYARSPVKPCMDGEPRYENHPIDWKPKENGWFDDYDVRQAAYWALFAGAHGHTYGCHDIWQFHTPQREAISFARGVWTESMDLPGARQVGYAGALIESRPMLARIPDQSILASEVEAGADRVRATRGEDYAFVYVPTGKPVRVKLDLLSGKELAAWWFDPRTGAARRIGTVANRGEREFTPPGTPGRGNDWVLVLDDAAKGYGAPGASTAARAGRSR
jgi:hypothetical protein